MSMEQFTDSELRLVIAQRINQMTKGAKRHRKYVPTSIEFASLVLGIQNENMQCPVCRRTMNWLYKNGRATVVTIQHDRCGTIRLMCKGCNSRHAQHPGDSFYDLPAAHKRCRKCEQIKPHSDFYFVNTTGFFSSRCRVCERKVSLQRYHADPKTCRKRSAEWKKKNRRRASENERLRRQKLKNKFKETNRESV